MLVIVPALNEERSIAGVVRSIREAVPAADVCVIDDGSTDRTAAIAGELGAIVLRMSVNLGIGGAVQAGYLWARDHGYDVAAQIDGDGQHDPSHLLPAIERIAGGTDLVIGSRFVARDVHGFRSTAVRRAGIRYLSALLRVRCGAEVTDPTSGFRVAGRRAIELFARRYPSDYPEPEAIALAVRSGLVVEEIAVHMRARAHGRSSIDALRTLYYLVKVSLGLILLPPRTAALNAEEEATRS